MKRFFLSLSMLFIALVTFGQSVLPIDPEVRVGKLENGLTYYIRHNGKPAERAEFYLATNVGAFQEEDDQDGLAHFLEHMCFNGTKNFPDKKLLEYLQGIGANFGRNINASTGFEQTQYMLNNIPIVREGIIDSCLLVLHDYAHYVTCDPKEIDAERGVILEERRSRRNADWRLFERALPYYFGDTHMARRTLIGGEEQLKTFRPESLVNFYRKWYHPDMQAVVVIGDFDVDMMEQKIKETFSSIPAPEVPTVKPITRIPANEVPVVGVLTDPEAATSGIEILWRGDALPKEMGNTDVAFMMDIIKAVIRIVFNERMEAITASANAPFLSAHLGISPICEGCEAVQAQVSFKDGDYKNALKAFYTEIEKIKRYGITVGEFERAKLELVSRAEKAVEAAPSRENGEFVWPILENFFGNSYLLTPDMRLQLTQAVCGQLQAAMFQQIMPQLITDANMVILYTAPEREGLAHPTQEELLAVINEVKAAEVEAPVEEGANEPLLNADAVKSGKVKKESAGAYGSTVWTLSNGVNVVYLPTKHKNDEVIIKLVKQGGRTLIETSELPSFEDNVWMLYQNNRGLSKFSGVELKKMLTGKNVHCSLNIGTTQHGVNVLTTPKDIETAMQLLYLNITAPRYSDEEYQAGLSQIKAILPNLEKQPTMKLQKHIVETVYGNHERRQILSGELVEKANIADVEKASQRLFGNVAGATVYVVGNVDAETLKPLVEKYIASLPGGKKGSKPVDHKEYIVKGEIVKDCVVEMETPLSTVIQAYSADMPYSLQNEVLLDAAVGYLEILYTETLREGEGGTYGASVGSMLSRDLKESAMLQVAFQTNPESAKKLSELAVSGMQKLIAEGVPADKLEMVVLNLKKNIPQDRISNNYWYSCLKNNVQYGEDYDTEYEAAVNAITSDAIVAVVKQLVEQNNFIQLTLSPEE